MCCGIDDELIGNRDFVRHQGLAQMLGESGTLLHLGVDSRIVMGDAVATKFLRLVHGDIGTTQKLMNRSVERATGGYADAGSEPQISSRGLDRLLEEFDELFGHPAG